MYFITFRFISENLENMMVYDLAQLDDLWMEYFLDEEETIENGICVIVDLKG